MARRTPIWWGKFTWRTYDGGTVEISALKRSECKARGMAEDVFKMAAIWFGADWCRKAMERAIRLVEKNKAKREAERAERGEGGG